MYKAIEFFLMLSILKRKKNSFMKKLLAAVILLIPSLIVNAQGIGEMAPEKKPTTFPDNVLGLDIMFSDGGFGLGGFYRRQLSNTITGFVDISMSEIKDEREFTYTYEDIYGYINTYTLGKVNRIFLVPIDFGVQYRLFEDAISDNLRPYINAGVGPSFVITTPYEREFFNAFGYANTKITLGSYIGFGANFGLDKSSLVGINLRYYIVHFFDHGVESLQGKFRRDIGGVYLTINLGLMY
jgi:hypothetical protein